MENDIDLISLNWLEVLNRLKISRYWKDKIEKYFWNKIKDD